MRPRPTSPCERTSATVVSVTYTPPSPFTTRPTLRGTFGMTASTHWLATASAQAVLERGGNAFDAAVAGAFVLHVVEPHLNGPGGDMTGVFATAVNPGVPVVLMGQGPAPAAATPERFRAEGLALVPGAGALAAAIPGAVDAWLLLLRDHGTWELDQVLAFAIGYARGGHPVLGRVCHTIAAVAGLFGEHWPSSAAFWMPNGRVPREGEVIRNEAYARTLDRLVGAGHHVPATGDGTQRGPDRRGPYGMARGIRRAGDRRLRDDPAPALLRHRPCRGDHAGGPGRLQAGYEPAVTATFRGHTIAKTGPWGQGPALLQMLSILDGFGDEHLDPSTALGAHTILEAEKLALADREAYYGDTDVPIDHLLSAGYAAGRRALITDRASTEFRPGTVPGRAPFHPPLLTEYVPPALSGPGPVCSRARANPRST